MDSERSPHLPQGAIERPACPMPMVVGIQDHLPAIGSDAFQELPAGSSHGPEAGRKLGFGIQLAQLAANEVADFQNGMDAVRGDL